MRPCFMRPNMVRAVNPYRLHAAIKRTQHIQSGVVTYMQHLHGLHTGGTRCSVKNSRLGLAVTKLLRADTGTEKLAETNALDIGVAIGHSHQWKARR